MVQPIRNLMPSEASRNYWRSVLATLPATPAQEEAPICSTCGGLGVITYDVPLGHEKYGRMFACPDPACPVVRSNWEERYRKISNDAQIPLAYRKMTFRAWQKLAEQYPYDPQRDLDGDYMAGKWGAYAAACMFIDSIDRGHRFSLDEAAKAFRLPLPEFESPKRKGFVFSGKNGVGKTSLVVAVANHLLETGRPVVYVRLDDFWSALRERFNQKASYEYAEGADDEADVMRLYQRAPVLIIDEFTPDKLTDWRLNVTHQLINYRYTNDLPTLITTNTTYNEFLDLWGGTTGGRVLAMCHWIEMVGLNLRPVAERWLSP